MIVLTSILIVFEKHASESSFVEAIKELDKFR